MNKPTPIQRLIQAVQDLIDYRRGEHLDVLYGKYNEYVLNNDSVKPMDALFFFENEVHLALEAYQKTICRTAPLDVRRLRAGDKVIFMGEHGSDSDREHAQREGLEVGLQYTVDIIDMGQSRTYLYLRGKRHSFNSVMFRGVA